MESKQILSFQVRVDLGIMAMKEYSTLPRSLELELLHQMQFSIIPRTLLTPLQSIQSVYSMLHQHSKMKGMVQGS